MSFIFVLGNEIFLVVYFQFQCCGVEGKADFVGTTKWNRTNPWASLSTLIYMQEFQYPLTCCPMGDVQQNWNNLPVDQLQQAAACALYGNNIYEVVSFIILSKSEITN
jgi:hypothetical protein